MTTKTGCLWAAAFFGRLNIFD